MLCCLKVKMEPRYVILCGALFAGLLFEAADGIGCFACSSSQRACKKDIMDELGASKDTDCDYCVTLYSTKPNIRTQRSCRKDKSGYYTKNMCKPTSFDGEHRCFCFTDWCNGKEQDTVYNEYIAAQSGGGSGSGTTKNPSSMAVSLSMSGQAVLGFMALTLLQHISM